MPNRRSAIDDLLLALAYFVAATAMITTTRFDQGVAFIWISTALLVPALLKRPADGWIRLLLMCAAASVVATGLFGLGWTLAGPLAVANIAEAWIGARLLRRQVSITSYFDSLSALAWFLLAVGLVAPLCGSIVASAALAAAGQDFVRTAFNFYVGHALGALTFIPVVSLVLSGEFARTLRGYSWRKAIDTTLVLVLVAATVFAVFWIRDYPLLFIPAGPMIVAIFRARLVGAAVSIILFAAIGGVLTATGHGPIQMTGLPLGGKMQFFQLCLAAYVLATLPIAADLKNRSRLYRELRESKERYQMMAEHSSDILFHLDVEGRILWASPAVARVANYDPQTLVGRMSSELLHPDDLERVRAEHRAALESGGDTHAFDYRGLTHDGRILWFETRTRAILDRAGRPAGVLSVVRDITARKVAEEDWIEAALTDPLTGIANRRAFREHAARLMADKRAQPLALALLDIDRFKGINDCFGHDAGDEVLKAFAIAIPEHLRDGDMLARIGGEEFAILFRSTGIDLAQQICERLRRAIARTPVSTSGGDVSLTVSCGVARIGGQGLGEATTRADAALYRAKNDGRDRVVVAA